jgi:hypothetical protein
MTAETVTPSTERLLGEIKSIDMDCKDLHEEVETLGRCLWGRAEAADECTARDVKRLTQMIEDRVHDTMSRVNKAAERVACNFKEAIHG